MANSAIDLLLPWSTSRLGGHTGSEGHVQLAGGGHVELHALLVRELGHGPTQEGLRCIGHAVAECLDSLTTAVTEVLLVVDEQRRAELGTQRLDVAAADEQPAVDDAVVIWEEPARQRRPSGHRRIVWLREQGPRTDTFGVPQPS